MEAVRAFNNELSSLYETKPPVSRAKMGAVTRAAIKAIKFYKHVVQSVEKFVLKCKPEYKIPGLYVIDSVVRQSRHQFGGEKDVFGPRFTKNIVITFQSLLKCSAEDRGRVVRVLNLWQKNTVFPMELIQALLDMASDPTSPEPVAAAQRIADTLVLAHQRSHGKLPDGGGAAAPGDGPAPSTGPTPAPASAHVVPANGNTTSGGVPEENLMNQQSDIVNTVAKLLQQTGDGNLLTSGQDVQLQQLQLLQHQLMMHTEAISHKPQQTTPVIDNNLLAQIKLLTDQLLSKTDTTPTPIPIPVPSSNAGVPPPPPPPLPSVRVNRPPPEAPGFVPGMEGPRDGAGLPHPAMGLEGRDGGPHLGAPAPIMAAGAPPHGEMHQPSEPVFNKKLLDFDYGDSEDEDGDHNQNEEGVQQHQHPHHPHHHHHHHHQQQQQQLPGDVHKLLSDPALLQHIHNVSSSLNSDQLRPDMPDAEALRKQHLEQQQEQFNKEIEQDQDVILVEEQEDRDREYDRDRRRSRHSRDRSRSPKRRRHSRSRSRERRRSRDRHRRSRSRDYDRGSRERQREKDRERKKKGLPPLKEKCISLCSTTLWFGHLAKYTTEKELRSEIENYGSVDSIKMVPPRGCAFVNMSVRKEAAKALDRMKGQKLNSSSLRVAWAPNMGVKESEFSKLWDVDLGVTYIQWSKLPADLTPLLDGAVVDEDSLPEHLKGTIAERPPAQQDTEETGLDNFTATSSGPPASFGVQNQAIPSSQHMPLIPPPMMIPPPGSLPPPGMHLPPGQMPPLPQGLPPGLMPPHGGPVSTPMALSRPPVSSIAGPLPHGFPPGHPPFGPPPNLPRPGLPPPGPGLPPFPPTNEDGNEWSDAMDEDMDEEDAGGRGPGPVLGAPPMIRMDVPSGPPPHTILPPHMPPGMMGPPGPIGLRMGPPGLLPMPVDNRFGSPVLRGMGPGGSPLRFVLGQRPSLVRPGGPFGFDAPHRLRSSPPRGGLMDRPGPSSEPGQADGGPFNGQFPFGPGAPNFREPPPNVAGAAPSKKLVDDDDDDDDKSPTYGEDSSSSPEYGEDGDDSEDTPSAAQDRGACGRDSLSTAVAGASRSSPSTSASAAPSRTKSGRLSRWGVHNDDNKKSHAFPDRLGGNNGLPSSTNSEATLST